MEKYIVSKDFLLWSEKRRWILTDFYTAIEKIIENNEPNKLELIKKSQDKCTVEYKENDEFFRNSNASNFGGDKFSIKGFPIQYYGEQELTDLFHQILGIQQE